MQEDKLSGQIKKELEEITKKMGFLLETKKIGDKTSLLIIDEFLKCSKDSFNLDKNLMTALLLISNHLISENIKQVFWQLNLNPENKMVLQLYLYLQMSSNFLDGFFLGHAFIKVKEGINILEKRDLDILEIFRHIYLIRMKHKESSLIQMIDETTGLIEHFEKAYKDLFITGSSLLNDLVKDNVQLVVKYLMLTFFDGILTAKIISENKTC
jgi:hypothetical protein